MDLLESICILNIQTNELNSVLFFHVYIHFACEGFFLPLLNCTFAVMVG